MLGAMAATVVLRHKWSGGFESGDIAKYQGKKARVLRQVYGVIWSEDSLGYLTNESIPKRDHEPLMYLDTIRYIDLGPFRGGYTVPGKVVWVHYRQIKKLP